MPFNPSIATKKLTVAMLVLTVLPFRAASETLVGKATKVRDADTAAIAVRGRNRVDIHRFATTAM